MLRRVSRVSEALLGLTLPAKTFSSRPSVAALAVRSRTHVSTFALVVYYCSCRNIVNSRRSKPAHPPPLSKQYTPYSPTNIALYFINRGPFDSSILGL